MELNRKSIALGVAGLGLFGVLAGGVGLAQAASGPTEPPATRTSATMPCPNTGTGMGVMMQGAPMTAAAKYLGLSLDDLRDQLRSGESLADIAKAQGKSVAGLKNAIIAAMRKSLDANTTLTAEQKATILEHMKSRVDAMVTGTHGPGGMMGNGMMGRGMGSGMWR